MQVTIDDIPHKITLPLNRVVARGISPGMVGFIQNQMFSTEVIFRVIRTWIAHLPLGGNRIIVSSENGLNPKVR
jgi:hypothetical protein